MKSLAYLFIIFLAIGCTSQPTETAHKKPNIVFIMSDDHAYQAISAFGHGLIQTPSIDRLAKEGILFENSFV